MHLKKPKRCTIAIATALLTACIPMAAIASEANQTQPSEAKQAAPTAATGSEGQSDSAGASGMESGQSGKGEKSGKTGADGLPAWHPPVNYLIVPVKSPEHDAWMKKGCWAKFYDSEKFSGDMLTLVGPADMPDMRGPFGIDWKGKISSVETGPAARVLVYDNEQYKDLVVTFKPGQKAPNVSKKMGFFDEFSSMRIACDNLK